MNVIVFHYRLSIPTENHLLSDDFANNSKNRKNEQ